MILSLLSPCHVLSGSRPSLESSGSRSPSPKAEGSYATVAENMAGAAARKSKKRIVVLPFINENGRKNMASVLITERLFSHIASRQEIELIERGRLDAILKEQGLQSSGIVDARTASTIGAVLGADAVITGTVIDIGNGMVELNARLVDTQTARVLNAVNRKITKDWEDSSAWSAGGAFETPDEDSQACRQSREKARELKKLVVKIKARQLAIKMKRGEVKIGKLTRNPGSDISNRALRSEFYAELKRWYYSPRIPDLTGQEKMVLKTADLLLKQLGDLCKQGN